MAFLSNPSTLFDLSLPSLRYLSAQKDFTTTSWTFFTPQLLVRTARFSTSPSDLKDRLNRVALLLRAADKDHQSAAMAHLQRYVQTEAMRSGFCTDCWVAALIAWATERAWLEVLELLKARERASSAGPTLQHQQKPESVGKEAPGTRLWMRLSARKRYNLMRLMPGNRPEIMLHVEASRSEGHFGTHDAWKLADEILSARTWEEAEILSRLLPGLDEPLFFNLQVLPPQVDRDRRRHSMPPAIEAQSLQPPNSEEMARDLHGLRVRQVFWHALASAERAMLEREAAAGVGNGIVQ